MAKKRKKKKGKQMHFDSLIVDDYRAAEYLINKEKEGVNVDMFAFHADYINTQYSRSQKFRRRHNKNLKKECNELLRTSTTDWNVTSIDNEVQTLIEG